MCNFLEYISNHENIDIPCWDIINIKLQDKTVKVVLQHITSTRIKVVDVHFRSIEDEQYIHGVIDAINFRWPMSKKVKRKIK